MKSIWHLYEIHMKSIWNPYDICIICRFSLFHRRRSGEDSEEEDQGRHPAPSGDDWDAHSIQVIEYFLDKWWIKGLTMVNWIFRNSCWVLLCCFFPMFLFRWCLRSIMASDGSNNINMCFGMMIQPCQPCPRCKRHKKKPKDNEKSCDTPEIPAERSVELAHWHQSRRIACLAILNGPWKRAEEEVLRSFLSCWK